MKRIRTLVLVSAVLLFILVLLVPLPEGLSEQGRRALAVFMLCSIFWVSSVVPLAMTSLLAMVLLPLLGVSGSRETFALFGNSAVFFILGAFMLAAAMMKTGLSTRAALILLNFFRGGGPFALSAGLMLSAAFLSCWMPEHAVAALMFPIVLDICHALKLKPMQSAYGKVLFLSMAWGAIIGGITTYLGGARNPLAVGMLRERYDLSIEFGQWAVAALPLTVCMLAVALVLLWWLFRPEPVKLDRAHQVLLNKWEALGRISRHEVLTLLMVLAAVFAWIFLTRFSDLAMTAILAAVLLSVLGVVDWHDIEKYVNWGVFLMYGGAIALGQVMAGSGAAEYLVSKLVSGFTLSPFIVIAILSLATIMLTEVISNAAALALVLPLGFSLGEHYGLAPQLVTFAVAIPSGLAFCLPMSTPPMMISYSAGFFRLRESMIGGMILNLTAWVMFLVLVRWYWPLLSI
ncbi:MAG: DASS family sodium-coupled anion symporter [Gemmatimonadota bacterium]|nr:DASS family sodium-coupled anion symporter [Gemmatimonadota bacterium]